MDKNKISIKIGDNTIVENGEISGIYDKSSVDSYMKGNNILIDVYINNGDFNTTVWTCDLTHRFIDINAHYFT